MLTSIWQSTVMLCPHDLITLSTWIWHLFLPDDCECPMLLEKSLPCGHINFVKCHVKPSEHFCKTQIERTLPRCRHTASMYCHEDINAFECKEIVTKTSTSLLSCSKTDCFNGMTTSKFLYNIFPTFNYANIHMTVNCNAMPTWFDYPFYLNFTWSQVNTFAKHK
jgi:hypothetical protein